MFQRVGHNKDKQLKKSLDEHQRNRLATTHLPRLRRLARRKRGGRTFRTVRFKRGYNEAKARFSSRQGWPCYGTDTCHSRTFSWFSHESHSRLIRNNYRTGNLHLPVVPRTNFSIRGLGSEMPTNDFTLLLRNFVKANI